MNQIDVMSWVNIILNVLALAALGWGWWRNRVSIRAVAKRLDEVAARQAADRAELTATLTNLASEQGRLANAMVGQTAQLDRLTGLTGHLADGRRQDELADKLAARLMGNGVRINQTVQSGGASYRDGTQVRGPAIGGDVTEQEK